MGPLYSNLFPCSGPYEVASFTSGKKVTFKRRKDFWGENLNVNKNQFNFDEINYYSFKHAESAIENIATKKTNFHLELNSKRWQYPINKKAEAKGALLKQRISLPFYSRQIYIAFNLRRTKFQNIKVRQAINCLFDKQWILEKILYNEYLIANEYFPGLQPINAIKAVSCDLLTPQQRRLKAHSLLTEAGWELKNRQRINAHDEVFNIQFLAFSPGLKRIIQPFINELNLLGIKTSVDIPDMSISIQRYRNFDFDLTYAMRKIDYLSAQSLQSQLSSESGKKSGSQNISGINDSVIDEIIKKIMNATSKNSIHQLLIKLNERLVLQNFMMPFFYNQSMRIAFWQGFHFLKQPPSKHFTFHDLINLAWFGKGSS